MTSLPPGWRSARLGDVADVRPGRTPRAFERRLSATHRTDRNVPFFKVGDMNSHVRHLRSARVWLALDEVSNFGLDLLPPGSVVFPKAGGAIATNKKRLLAVAGAVDLNCMAVVPGDEIDERFLYHWFQALDLSQISDGSVLPQISKRRVLELTVSVPPLDEQHRIVVTLEDHLSRLDDAGGSLASSKHRVGTLWRSLLEEGIRSRRYETRPLRDVIQRVEAGRSFGGSSAPASPAEWGIIKVSAMTWGEFRPEENKRVPTERVDPRFEIRSGDLLVSRANTNDYVGAPVLVGATRPRLALSDKSLRLVPRNDVDSRWLLRALSSQTVRRQISARATGTKDSMRNISQAALLAVELPVPSLGDQLDIADALDACDRRLRRLEQQLAVAVSHARVLRHALLSAAFSGRLSRSSSRGELLEALTSV